MTDGILVQRSRDGDKEAFSVLVERYRHQVYALAFHYVHNFEAAHDLSQEAFIQAYLKLDRLREADKFIAWLRTLTANLCRSWLRRTQLETVSLEDSEAADSHDPQKAPHLLLEQAQHEAYVHRLIAALPERQRLAVTLFYIGGLSYQEIADFLGESVNAIESRLHRARRHLQERMTTMIDESFEPHQLPEHFTDEVLQQVQAIEVQGIENQQEGRQVPTVLLADEKQRRFYIHLNNDEARAIMAKVSGEPFPRPLPQTMLLDIMAAFDIKLEQVVLEDMRRGEFRARLVVCCDGQRHNLEAGAGDALALTWELKTNPEQQNSSPELLATPTALRKARRLEALRAKAGPDSRSVETTGKETEQGELPAGETQDKEATVVADAEALPAAPLYLMMQSHSQAERKQRYNIQRPKSWRRIVWSQQPQVNIKALTADAKETAMVVLGGAQGRTLALWIGTSSAYSIKAGLGTHSANREVDIGLPPLGENSGLAGAHDLIKSLLSVCGVELLWVAVDDMYRAVFYSVAALQHKGQMQHIDARPSDSLALAVRCGCPIYVTNQVMKEHSVIWEGGANGADQVVELVQARSRALQAAHDLIRDALQALHDRNLRSAFVSLTRDGDACRAIVADESGRPYWEMVGSSFTQCLTLLYNMTEMKKSKPLPHAGIGEGIAGNDMVGYKKYPFEVIVKGKGGPVELRLGEPAVLQSLSSKGIV